MSNSISFLNTPLLYIDSSIFNSEKEAEIFDTISEYGRDTDVSYQFINDGLYADEGNYSPNDLVDIIKKIIKYLNKNRIKWEGGKSSFIHGDEHGFIVITNDNAIIGYIDDEGEVEKEYIPLTENRRL